MMNTTQRSLMISDRRAQVNVSTALAMMKPLQPEGYGTEHRRRLRLLHGATDCDEKDSRWGAAALPAETMPARCL